jgi:hypothetical protein
LDTLKDLFKGTFNPQTDKMMYKPAITGKNKDGVSWRLPKRASHVGEGFTFDVFGEIASNLMA